MSNKYFIVNVEGAIYKDDYWLIIKRSEKEENAPGTLSLVGGKVENVTDKADVLEEALKREIDEEVGIEVHEDVYYIQSKAFIADDGNPIVDVVFLCRYKSGEAGCMSKEEVDGVFWMTKQEIMNCEKAPWYLKNSIEHADKLRREKGS